jgi:integrase
MTMPRKVPPFVERFRDRHGKPRIYFRRGKGKRVPLPGNLGSDEFLGAYQAALSSQIEPGRRPESDKPGSLSALVASYMRNSAYLELRSTTKRGYSSRIKALRMAHGHRLVSGLTRERILTFILEPYANKPGARLAMLKLLRVLIRHAMDIGWLNHDPSVHIRRPKTQEIRSWTDAEIATFEARWPIGTKQRLAFALMLYTGQRRSDVHRMTWADVNGSTINVVQQKTGEKLSIRLHQKLREILATTERQHVTILNTAFGQPFTVNGFSQWLRAAITAADLPLDCQPHGLRKAAGRLLAEAGCSANEIMSVLGHRTLSEATRYTREADQPLLSAAAITRLEARNANVLAQTVGSGLAETSKKKGRTK